MKTIRYKTAGIFCILGLLAFSLSGFSQGTKLTRQEMKEVRKAQLAENFRILDSLLNAKSFVLEADYLSNKYGDRIVVTSNLNFIKLDKETGILQTGSNTGFGYNGVGGVTAEGRLGSWKVFKDPKRMNYTVQFSLLTNIGNYDVSMLVSADAGARATITGLGPGKLTWEGHLETVGNSRVFKGRNIIG